MSSNNHRTDEDDAHYEAADRIVREILDNDLTAAEISPSGELFRAIARFNRNIRGEPDHTPASSSPQERARQEELRTRFRATRIAMDQVRERRRVREQQIANSVDRDMPTIAGYYLPPTSQPLVADGSGPLPSRSYFFTPRTTSPNGTHTPSSVHVSRRTPRSGVRTMVDNRRPATTGTSSALSDLHDAGQQLEFASTHLRALLNEPIPDAASRDLEHAPDEEIETNRAFKRRKVDTGEPPPDFKGFSYGHYGQVEPGKLNMEIESCDGGIYSEEHGGNYGAGNILKADDTVYCTKGNRCNLVLRHQGATSFCIQEIIIKAPDRGFTAPVKEGMVFISMTSDDLLARTAHYQIQYSPIRRHSTTGRPVISVRHNPDGTTNSAYDPAPTPPERHYRLAQIPSAFQLPTPLPFTVTTSCSDDEDDTEPNPRTRYMGRRGGSRLAPNRIGSLRFEQSDSSSSEDEDQRIEEILNPNSTDFDWPHGSRSRPSAHSRQAEQEATSEARHDISTQLSDAIDRADAATQEAVRAVGGSGPGGFLMAPHAKFFIEREKSKCSIRFDPPVSGRFVLLKMWSPQHRPGGNIDIQSVTVRGFAGPRFFPAVKPR